MRSFPNASGFDNMMIYKQRLPLAGHNVPHPTRFFPSFWDTFCESPWWELQAVLRSFLLLSRILWQAHLPVAVVDPVVRSTCPHNQQLDELSTVSDKTRAAVESRYFLLSILARIIHVP